MISAKKRTVPIPGMTYFAPVTMATRPCKSSRSRSGEILDVALPMASTRGGKVAKTVPPVCRASRGFMNYDKCLEPSLFKRDYSLQEPFRSGAELGSLHENSETPIQQITMLGKCTHTYWLRRQGGPPQSYLNCLIHVMPSLELTANAWAVVDLESNSISSTNKTKVCRARDHPKLK
jgi:hypothetical protein